MLSPRPAVSPPLREARDDTFPQVSQYNPPAAAQARTVTTSSTRACDCECLGCIFHEVAAAPTPMTVRNRQESMIHSEELSYRLSNLDVSGSYPSVYGITPRQTDFAQGIADMADAVNGEINCPDAFIDFEPRTPEHNEIDDNPFPNFISPTELYETQDNEIFDFDDFDDMADSVIVHADDSSGTQSTYSSMKSSLCLSSRAQSHILKGVGTVHGHETKTEQYTFLRLN